MTEPVDTAREEEKQILRILSIYHAVKDAPVHSLPDLLALHKITNLRRLARLLQVKYYARKPKPELIADMAETLTVPENLQQLIPVLGRHSVELLIDAAAQPELERDGFIPGHFLPLRILGLIELFYHDDRLILVMPDEIRRTFQQVAASGFVDRRRFELLVTDAAVAAVNLYGVIGLDEFTKLFNDLNGDDAERPVSGDELAAIVKSAAGDSIGFHFRKGMLVDDTFAEDGYTGVANLVKARAAKPRYTPGRDEFFEYADWNHYEWTPQLEALQDHLAEKIGDDEALDDLIDEIHDLTAAEARMQEIADAMEEAGVVFKDLNEIRETMNLIMAVHNSTRLWSNFGHTPDELNRISQKYQPVQRAKVIPFPGAAPATAGDKPGRNDPCPCGSGKKYKNCCGK